MTRLIAVALLCSQIMIGIDAFAVPDTGSNMMLSELSVEGKSGKGRWEAPGASKTRPGKKNDDLLGGLILGIILWIVTPIGLWNNERIAIKQYKIQLKAERWAVHVDDPSQGPIEEMEGHVVYVTGTSKCDTTLQDSVFTQVTTKGSLKLRRVVQMYQWIEYENEDNDGRKYYTYKKDWLDRYEEVNHDSSKRNPQMPFQSTRREKNNYRAWSSTNGVECAEAPHNDVRLGAYYLGEYVIRELVNWKSMSLQSEQLQTGAVQGAAREQGGWWYFGGRSGQNVGDVRVQFEELMPGPLTICGILTQSEAGWTFVPIIRTGGQGAAEGLAAELGGGCCVRVKELHYDADEKGDLEDFKKHLKDRGSELTKQEHKQFRRAATTAAVKEYDAATDDEGDLCCVGCCGSLINKFMEWAGLEAEYLGVQERNMSLSQLAAKERRDAGSRSCTCRVVGLLLLILGSWLIIKPVVVLLNYHWLISLFGGAIISFIIILAALLFSLAACLTIVSIAWIFHRPIMAGLGFLGAAGCIGLFWFMAEEEQKKQAAKAGAEAGKVAFLQLSHMTRFGH